MTSSSNGESRIEQEASENRKEDEQNSPLEEEFQEFPADDSTNGGYSDTADSANSESSRSDEPDFRDKYVRLLAEFDNYKKWVAKERSELIKYQGEQIFIDLLEVVDNFERALEHASAEASQLREGIEMIHRSFLAVLNKWGVKGESGIGAPFDPNKQSALSQIPAPGATPGHVVNELKKAYFYKDKLIRPGEVVVAKE